MRAGLIVVAALFIGCSDEREPIPEAGTRVDAPVIDPVDSGASPDVSMDAPAGDGYIDLFDVFPLPDAGCPACIRDRCGAQVNACFNNPACATGLLCTLQMCAGGLLGEGGFNPSSFVCVLGCFNGDQATAITAIGALTCLTMTCAPACNFLDAGVANPDVRTPTDGVADAPADASVDATAPDSGPATDGDDNTDGDDVTPGTDAVAGDATPETGGQLDAPPAMDVTPMDTTSEAAPPNEGGSAD